MGNGESVNKQSSVIEKQNISENTEKKVDELAVLSGEGKTYKIAGETVEQKPLVIKEITKGFQFVIKVISIFIETVDNDEEVEVEPNFILKLMSKSEKFTEAVIDLLTLVLKKDRKFINENITFSILSQILLDFWELNEVGEAFGNFQKLILNVKEKMISKEVQDQTKKKKQLGQ